MDGTKTLKGKGPEYGFERGLCLPDVEFVTVEGVRKQLSDYRGRRNLVVILAGKQGHDLPAALAAAEAEIERHEGQVIAVLPEASPAALPGPFDVVADPDGTVRRKFSSGDSDESALAVFVTDRWSEIMFAHKAGQGDPAPDAAEILDWLRFADQQCPECFPSEWPA